MSAIFRRLPFFDRATTLELQGQRIHIFPRQIVVWVSLSMTGRREFAGLTPKFPAVLDPGFTDSFLIHPRLLRQFAGLTPQHLRQTNDSLRAHERVIPIHAADHWLHPNRPNERDEFADRPPFLVELDRGIGIPTTEELYPRLPLLGAGALRAARLQVVIDYARLLLTVRTRRRFWLFG